MNSGYLLFEGTLVLSGCLFRMDMIVVVYSLALVVQIDRVFAVAGTGNYKRHIHSA